MLIDHLTSVFATREHLHQYGGFVLFLVIFIYLLSTKFHGGLHKIPGPFLASYTNLWRIWDVSTGNSMNTAVRIHKKWGYLVRTGPNHVSISDPAAVNVIYSVAGGFTKTEFYPIQSVRYKKSALPNLFSTLDESYHRKLKRPVAHAYSMAAMMKMEAKIDSVSKNFVEKLRGEFTEVGQEVDLGTWLQYYAFDVIGNLTFSETFGFINESRDIDNMIESLNGFFFYAAVVGQMPLLHRFLLGNPLLPILYPPMEKFNPAVNFASKIIAKRVPDSKNNDFMAIFESIRSERPDQFGDTEIMNHVSTNVLAGSDTTAIALRTIFDHILRSPRCYQKLQREIDSAVAMGKLSLPCQFSEASHMPYLQAVVKEAIRLHPSVGMMMERYVPKGGSTICGTWLPEGTIVGMNAWVVSRDPVVYGEDSESFRPERWIEADPEKLKIMERSSLAFGGGSRVCIGKNISLMEISKLIPTLLWEFEIKLVDPSKELEIKNYWFSVQYGLKCNLTIRQH